MREAALGCVSMFGKQTDFAKSSYYVRSGHVVEKCAIVARIFSEIGIFEPRWSRIQEFVGESISLLSQTARNPEAEMDAQRWRASRCKVRMLFVRGSHQFRASLASTERHLQAPCCSLLERVPVDLWRLFLPVHRRWWRVRLAEVSSLNTRNMA